MPKILETMFTTYSFTPEEAAQAMVLTELQEKFIITERSVRASEQLLMALNDLPREEFEKRWQRSIGYMEALTWILTCSQDTRNELMQALQQSKLDAMNATGGHT